MSLKVKTEKNDGIFRNVKVELTTDKAMEFAGMSRRRRRQESDDIIRNNNMEVKTEKRWNLRLFQGGGDDRKAMTFAGI